MRNLEVLHLHHNKFTGTFPNLFDHMPRITDLQLNNNQFKGTIPSSIFNLQRLSKLDSIFESEHTHI